MRVPRSTTMAADIAARTWTLAFRSKPEFEAASDRELIAPVILIGVLISLLLAGANLFQSRARSALNASEMRYRRLFEASPDGVFLFDSDSGLLTDANPYMVELLGQPRELLIGKALWEIGLFDGCRGRPQSLSGTAEKGLLPFRTTARYCFQRSALARGSHLQCVQDRRQASHAMQRAQYHRPQARRGRAARQRGTLPHPRRSIAAGGVDRRSRRRPDLRQPVLDRIQRHEPGAKPGSRMAFADPSGRPCSACWKPGATRSHPARCWKPN